MNTCLSEKCKKFSPFTCGHSRKFDLRSVYCNPDFDNCLSFNPTTKLEQKSNNTNFSYFGCVKRPEVIENPSRKFGIECLVDCAQKGFIIALMRPGFKGKVKSFNFHD